MRTDRQTDRWVAGAILIGIPQVCEREYKRTKLANHVACMKNINAYKSLVGNPRRKRPLGRHRRGWKYDIKIQLRSVGCDKA
jgi:hypothetical protein